MWWPYKWANSVVHASEFVVGEWDGLDDCEISQPEILSQSAPDILYFYILLK